MPGAAPATHHVGREVARVVACGHQPTHPSEYPIGVKCRRAVDLDVPHLGQQRVVPGHRGSAPGREHHRRPAAAWQILRELCHALYTRASHRGEIICHDQHAPHLRAPGISPISCRAVARRADTIGRGHRRTARTNGSQGQGTYDANAVTLGWRPPRTREVGEPPLA